MSEPPDASNLTPTEIASNVAGQPLTGLPGTGQPTPTRPGRPATPEEFEQFITDHAHLMLAPDGEG